MFLQCLQIFIDMCVLCFICKFENHLDFACIILFEQHFDYFILLLFNFSSYLNNNNFKIILL